MKCPQCGYDNREDALACNMCRAVLRRERKAASPPALRAPAPKAPPPVEPTAEPPRLDSPAAVKALLEHVFRVGKEALKAGGQDLAGGEVARLAGRFFLEMKPQDCRTQVLAPTAANWLAVSIPRLLSPEEHAKARALLDAMLDAAAARRFGDALDRLRQADAVAASHNWPELLILGLGLRRASEQTEPQRARAHSAAPAPPPSVPPAARPLAKGDVLDQKFEIHGVLGEGGFGIVYLAYHRPSGAAMALKTFRDEYLADAQARELFRKEAQILVDLDPHPNLVRAYLVDEIHGRLFIALEYIAPDDDRLNTLEGHLKRRPPGLAQGLRWAIQFCHGMEFAVSRGLRCHRDIKPANIMIEDGRRLLISDFGLAGALQASKLTGKAVRPLPGADGRTAAGSSFGTPTHMPPEQFLGADRCDERSDVYAFGVVLFQLAAGGRVPFFCDDRQGFWEGMYRLHATAPVPPLDSPLFPIVQRCLQKSPVARYQRFAELRPHLETLLKKTTGETAPPPEVEAREDRAWNGKGLSLRALGRHEEALACFDRALAIAETSQSWNNKGAVYMRLRRWADAVACFDRAIALEDDDHPWVNKAGALLGLGRTQEALAAAEAALQRNPSSLGAWSNKGACLESLGRTEEALQALDRALQIDPSSEETWATKVAALQKAGRVDEALAAADHCLSIHPTFAIGWTNKGYCLLSLGKNEEALACFEHAVGLDAALINAWAGKRTACKALGRAAEVMAALDRELELAPAHGPTWFDKGRELIESKRWEEALACLRKATELEAEWPLAWTNLGLCLLNVGRLEEAQAAYGRAVALNPQFASASLARGDILMKLGRRADAIPCFESAIAAGPANNSGNSLGAAWYFKADCLHRLGRFGEAAACYGTALGLLPEQVRGHVAAAAEACRKGLPPPA